MTSRSGSMVEVGIVASEGLVGASPVLLGSDRTPFEVFVQSLGELLAVDTETGAGWSRSRSRRRTRRDH